MLVVETSIETIDSHYSPIKNFLNLGNGEVTMAEEKKSKDEIGNEFEKLGENIRQVVQGAWESEERKRIGKEIHDGLIEIGETFTRLGEEFVENPGVQRVREEVDDFSERIQSGEVVQKINDDLVSLLQS